MGVRAYGKRWRSWVTDIQGVVHQEYFDTEGEAWDFFHLKSKGKASHRRYKKRSNSKDDDLPVGIFEYPYTCVRNGREYFYQVLRCAVYCKQKGQKTRVRSYGKSSTRCQAIEELVQWQEEMEGFVYE